MIVVLGVQVINARVNIFFRVGDSGVKPEQAPVADKTVAVELFHDGIQVIGLINGDSHRPVFPSEGQHIGGADPEHPSGSNADGENQPQPHNRCQHIGDAQQSLTPATFGTPLLGLVCLGRLVLLGFLRVGSVQHPGEILVFLPEIQVVGRFLFVFFFVFRKLRDNRFFGRFRRDFRLFFRGFRVFRQGLLGLRIFCFGFLDGHHGRFCFRRDFGDLRLCGCFRFLGNGGHFFRRFHGFGLRFLRRCFRLLEIQGDFFRFRFGGLRSFLRRFTGKAQRLKQGNFLRFRLLSGNAAFQKGGLFFTFFFHFLLRGFQRITTCRTTSWAVSSPRRAVISSRAKGTAQPAEVPVITLPSTTAAASGTITALPIWVSQPG